MADEARAFHVHGGAHRDDDLADVLGRADPFRGVEVDWDRRHAASGGEGCHRCRGIARQNAANPLRPAAQRT